ncbi:MAG: tRNA pseudouridine(55) synthase TruB [Actinomycetota bacterium]
MTAGVLVIDKPAGMTSHDVVDEVRGRLRTKKVGHAGTLDPNATGLLIVGIGVATRFLTYAQHGPKKYRATARFGAATSTHDAWGEIVERKDCAGLDEARLKTALGQFTGDIEQVPPMVSALKAKGERLYAKARRGEEVERAARAVTVHELNLVALRIAADPPEADLEVVCSGGTYVRTLIHDLGHALDCGAHMSALRRMETGGFTEADAVALDDVSPDALRPLVDAVRELRRVVLDDDDAALVSHGRPLPVRDESIADGEPVALTSGDRLVAVYGRAGDRLIADRVVGSA